MRGWEKVLCANGNQKKAMVPILNIAVKKDLKIKIVTGDKKGHYLVIKGSIQQEDITIINAYEPDIGTPKYIKQILTDIKDNLTVTQY